MCLRMHVCSYARTLSEVRGDIWVGHRGRGRLWGIYRTGVGYGRSIGQE